MVPFANAVDQPETGARRRNAGPQQPARSLDSCVRNLSETQFPQRIVRSVLPLPHSHRRATAFGTWSLEVLWSLVLGAWQLVGACVANCKLVRLPLAFAITLIASLASTTNAASATSNPIDFNRNIRPIFSENCYACHGPDKDKRKAGLRLDVKEGAFNKLDSGDVAIVPGKPDQSKLLKLVSLPLDHDDHMPPKKTGKQPRTAPIELLRRAIQPGTNWDR